MATVKFSGREVTVKTLTVRQVKELVDGFAGDDSGPHILDMLFNDEVPAVAVAVATGLSLDELAGNIDPAEVRELWDTVRAENPFFVGMMERLVAAGAQVGRPSSPRSAD